MDFLKNMEFSHRNLRNALENRFWFVGLPGLSVKNSHLHLLSNLHVLLAPTPVALGHRSRKKWQGYVLGPFLEISCLALLVKILNELGGCIMKSRGSFHKRSSDQKSKISRLFGFREFFSTGNEKFASEPFMYGRRMAPLCFQKFHQRYSYVNMCCQGLLCGGEFSKKYRSTGPRTQAVRKIQVKH